MIWASLSSGQWHIRVGDMATFLSHWQLPLQLVTDIIIIMLLYWSLLWHNCHRATDTQIMCHAGMTNILFLWVHCWRVTTSDNHHRVQRFTATAYSDKSHLGWTKLRKVHIKFLLHKENIYICSVIRPVQLLRSSLQILVDQLFLCDWQVLFKCVFFSSQLVCICIVKQ